MVGLIDITGNQYGRLTVIERADGDKCGRTQWVCRCECGNTTVVHSNHLRSSATKSCGCLKRECDKARAMPEGNAAMRALYRHYKRNAKHRSLCWELTEEQFKTLTSLPCHYCGTEPQQVTKYERYNGNYVYNGLDRKDNEEGYSLGNIVPCCSGCNYLKFSKSYGEFLGQIKGIAMHRLGMRGS